MKAGIFAGSEQPHENAILVCVRQAPGFPGDRNFKPHNQVSIFAGRIDEDGEYIIIELSGEEREAIGSALSSINAQPDAWYWSILLHD